MNSRQRNLLDMFRNVVKWLNDHVSGLTEVPDLDATLPELENKVGEIDRIAAQTEETSAGATEEKDFARNRLTLAMMKLVNAMKLYAVRTGKIALLNEVDFRKYQLDQSSSQLLMNRAALFLSKAQGVAADENAATYKVTPERIAALESALADYKSQVTGPRQAVAAKKDANQALAELMDDTNDFLKDVVDVQMGTIEFDQPDLYNQYQNVRVIVDR